MSLDVDPRFSRAAQVLLAWLQRYDPNYRVTSSRRSAASQARLYADYLAGKNRYTVAPPGCSKHQVGFAVDVASSKRDPFKDPYLAYLGRWWRSIGGEWGGEKDPIHFALPGKLC